MTFHYKYFKDFPGWKDLSSPETLAFHEFLKVKCKDWNEDAFKGLALFMRNEKIYDPRRAFDLIKNDLDTNIKPKLGI